MQFLGVIKRDDLSVRGGRVRKNERNSDTYRRIVRHSWMQHLIMPRGIILAFLNIFIMTVFLGEPLATHYLAPA